MLNSTFQTGDAWGSVSSSSMSMLELSPLKLYRSTEVPWPSATRSTGRPSVGAQCTLTMVADASDAGSCATRCHVMKGAEYCHTSAEDLLPTTMRGAAPGVKGRQEKQLHASFTPAVWNLNLLCLDHELGAKTRSASNRWISPLSDKAASTRPCWRGANARCLTEQPGLHCSSAVCVHCRSFLSSCMLLSLQMLGRGASHIKTLPDSDPPATSRPDSGCGHARFVMAHGASTWLTRLQSAVAPVVSQICT
mmetsp:Transcript_12406/g.26806  ORF Transcript_12406/g.26806 Transcript_12406/m.26806 type:complete len:250 (-) Transcript_12406:189-938(-)